MKGLWTVGFATFLVPRRFFWWRRTLRPVGLAAASQCRDCSLVVELPCRPARFQRDVAVAGVPLKLFMLSCEAGGVTYGVATADVVDPTRVDAVLHALTDSARAAIRSAACRADWRVHTPEAGRPDSPGNSSAHLRRKRPDGEAVDESIRVFARGQPAYSEASALEAALLPETSPSSWSGTAYASPWTKAIPAPAPEHRDGAVPSIRSDELPTNGGDVPANGWLRSRSGKLPGR